MNKRSFALFTGWSIIIMALVAGFVFGYTLPEFSSAKEGMSLQEFIESKQSLYFSMLAGLIIIQVLDLIVSYTFYKFFLQQHRKIAVISGGLRFLYSLIFIFASLFLFKNLTDNTLYDEWILSNIQFFHNIWTFGLIIFGIHILC